MDQHVHDALDRPVWSALTGPQATLAQGQASALRIDRSYGPFAAASPGNEAGLAALLQDCEDELWLIEDAPVCAPAGTVLRKVARLMQMVATGPVDQGSGFECVPLGRADLSAMTALALANRPGPWGPSTWQYGQFYGVRREGRLIAMAGERLRPAPGIIEVSGVCTDPAYRGQGLAAQLIRKVMAAHRARGAASFLHSYADNAAAIALYRSMGFVERSERIVTILGKVG